MRILTAVLVFSVVMGVDAGQASGTWTWTTIDCPWQPMPFLCSYLDGISGSNLIGAEYWGPVAYTNGSWWSVSRSGWDYTVPLGIYGDKIVGYSSQDSSIGIEHGFLYDGSRYVPFEYPGASSSAACGIFGNRIVGYYYDNGTHGYLHDETGWHKLDYPGSTHTSAGGVDGTRIVGNWGNESVYQHGFVYDGSTWTDLSFPGASTTGISGVSGDYIVGVYSLNGQHSFLYDGRTWITLEYPSGHDTYVRGIDGNNIVGSYKDANGWSRGFLLTIPEPATLSLLALGGLLIARRRRG